MNPSVVYVSVRDAEIIETPGGMNAVKRVGRNFKFAKKVMLNSEIHCLISQSPHGA